MTGVVNVVLELMGVVFYIVLWEIIKPESEDNTVITLFEISHIIALLTFLFCVWFV